PHLTRPWPRSLGTTQVGGRSRSTRRFRSISSERILRIERPEARGKGEFRRFGAEGPSHPPRPRDQRGGLAGTEPTAARGKCQSAERRTPFRERAATSRPPPCRSLAFHPSGQYAVRSETTTHSAWVASASSWRTIPRRARERLNPVVN